MYILYCHDDSESGTCSDFPPLVQDSLSSTMDTATYFVPRVYYYFTLVCTYYAYIATWSCDLDLESDWHAVNLHGRYRSYRHLSRPLLTFCTRVGWLVRLHDYISSPLNSSPAVWPPSSRKNVMCNSMCNTSVYKVTLHMDDVCTQHIVHIHTFPLGSCDQCLPYVPLCEHHRGLDIVPVLLSVGVNTARTTTAYAS